jgi:two-component system sensor histidine kinase UhpB
VTSREHDGRDISPAKEIQTAVRESEEKWRSLAENAPNLIMIVSRDGTLEYINHTVSGITMAEAIGSSIYDYIDPKHHQAVREPLERVFSTGEPGMYVIEGVGPDGTTAWYETQVGSIRRRGEVVAATFITTDITARREMESALQQSKEQWQSLVQNAPAVIVVVDREGTVLYLNHTMFDGSAEDALGKHVHDFASSEEQRTVDAALDKAFSTGEPTTFETPYPTPDGDLIWIEARVGRVKWEKGESAAAIIATDISARKKAEQALAESEATFRSIVNNATDGILVADVQAKRFILANATICEMLGYTEEELLELGVSDIHPEEDLPRVVEVFEKQANAEISLACDIPMLRMDGSVFYADINAAVITMEGQERLMGIFRDATDRRQIQEDLRRSREELRHLYARLSDVREEERTMIAREIHDGLGQSLAVLSMQLELLRAKPPKRSEEVSRKLASMADLVERSVAEMRKICTELKPGVLDHLGLGPAVEWQAEEFEERTRIRCHLNTDLENVSLDQNLATAVFRILQESLANVARHSEADEVWINCGKKGRRIELVVSDDGKGITPEQASDSKSLGIAGMRERALEWGGELDITGVADEGTTVSVTVPIRRRARKND